MKARTVVVVPCGRDKLDRPAPAGELYTGAQHKLSRAAAAALAAPVRILSARHGLLELERVIEPYDTTFGAGVASVISLEALAEQLVALGAEQLVMLTPKAYSAHVRAAVDSRRDELARLDLLDVLAGSGGIGVQRGRLSRIKRDGWSAL